MKPALRLLAVGGLVAVASGGCGLLFTLVAPPVGSADATPTPVLSRPNPAGSASFTTAAGDRCLIAKYSVAAGRDLPVTDERASETRDIVEQRLSAAGFDVGEVQQLGTDGLLVELRVVDTGDQATIGRLDHLVTTTGRLTFVGVPDAFADQVVDGARLPDGMPATPILGGEQVAAVRAGTDQTGQPAIDLDLTDAGAAAFDAYAASHMDKPFAIVLDGIVQSAPIMQTTHFGGRAEITGSFNTQQVSDLVTVLTFGSLPLQVGGGDVIVGPCDHP